MRLIIILIILLFGSITLLSQQESSLPELNFHVPTKGKLTSMFGWRMQKNSIGIKERKFHRGIDIAGKYGETIYAAKSGKVVFVGWNAGYGRYVEIKHDERYSTCYCHLRRFSVSKGDSVITGEKIGEMGNSGTTFSTIGGKGVHLHFEIRDNTKVKWNNPKGTINPIRYLKNYKFLEKYDVVSFQYEIIKLPLYKAQIINTEYLAEYQSINSYMFYKPDLNPVLLTNISNRSKKQYHVVKNKIENITKIKSKESRIIENVYFAENKKIDIKREVNYEIKTISKPKTIVNNKFYAIQIEAHHKKLSDIQLKQLKNKYKVSCIKWDKVEINGKLWYKYTIGFFESEEEAKHYKQKLLNENILNNAAICKYVNNEIIRTIW